VYSWGSGLYHALGHGEMKSEGRPRLVEALEGLGELRAGRWEEGREGGRERGVGCGRMDLAG
jgi:hypothetical protein